LNSMDWRPRFRIVPMINPMHDGRDALRMVREFIELHMPPGTLPARVWTDLHAREEAEALIQAICESSLRYRYLWCLRCEEVRPFSFMRVRSDPQNNYSGGHLACDICLEVAVTFHERAVTPAHRQGDLFKRLSRP